MITDERVQSYVDGLIDLTTVLPSEEAALINELVTKTRTLPGAGMMMGPYQGSLLRILARTSGVRRVLEVGTFTGFSALCMAAALPEEGTVTTVDVNEETTALAKSFWQRSRYGKRITALIGDGLQVVSGLDGPFDMVLVDADKERLGDYWEALLPKVTTGGLLLVDNTLRGGTVAAPDGDGARTIDAFNRTVFADPRVDAVLVTVRDGLTVACKTAS